MERGGCARPRFRFSGWSTHRAGHRQAAGTRLVDDKNGEDGGNLVGVREKRVRAAANCGWSSRMSCAAIILQFPTTAQM